MNAHIETHTSRFSGELHNLGIINRLVNDLECIEEIHQIKLSLVGLTLKLDAQDRTRKVALIDVTHAIAKLEDAQNIIRSAN